jgi:hypothetical protein
MINKTECHSYFAICSNGEIKDSVGFIAFPNSDFNPDYITEKLSIQPYETKRMGDSRKNSNGTYPFSDWTACYQDTPALDAEEQCMKIIHILNDKIYELTQIKNEFNVTFCINIIPHIYNEESPAIVINKQIIDFCYATGTEIGVDLYVYDKD